MLSVVLNEVLGLFESDLFYVTDLWGAKEMIRRMLQGRNLSKHTLFLNLTP